MVLIFQCVILKVQRLKAHTLDMDCMLFLQQQYHFEQISQTFLCLNIPTCSIGKMKASLNKVSGNFNH